ncbi:MAG TPA: SCO6880 family protein [Microbacterium sp.]|uniref:SCO6880 family protein n=1 Tax=Microbacterium sp. TaxID=51671 RepID=UPI002B45DA87|nr:SCO6880 family protein [Microbacterium sp.]HKT58184.1 SCO6880 family protein [Microbacterium sp.]
MTASTAHSSHERPVRLPRRSGQGVVMGMDPWQLGFLTAAALVLLIAINRSGPLGLLYGIPLYLPLGAAAFTTIRGISAPKMAGLWVMKQIRHAAGATETRFRPERVELAGTLNLPGVRASIQLWDVDGIACVYNPQDRSASVTAELEVQGFLMHDTDDRYDLAQQWATVLASFTQRPGIKRITLQERTLPTTIRPARDHFDTVVRNRELDATSPIAENYREVMDESERFAVAHRNYLTFTLDLVALGSQLKSLGGGQDAIRTLAYVEARNLADALQSARIKVRRWLTTRDIAALGRTVFDPEFAAFIQNRPDDQAGVDPIAIGPMYLEEPAHQNGVVFTDSGVHTTMWIHEWPRSDAPVGFISPVVFARMPHTGEAITHTFSLVLTPVPVSKALRRIRDDKKVWRGNEKLRAKRGADGSAADAADWEALEKQEEEIVAGHGEFRYGGYLTVTAPDKERLEQAIAGMRNALSRAGMEAQILYCQQAEALMVNALPIGLGMK